MNKSQIGSTAAVVLALAVAFGAFGSHALKEALSPERFEVYQIAVKYQFYHGLGLFFLFVLQNLRDELNLKLVSRFMIIGLAIFCCSLYGIAFGEYFDKDWGFLGMITPVGGILLLVSWILLAHRIWSSKTIG